MPAVAFDLLDYTMSCTDLVEDSIGKGLEALGTPTTRGDRSDELVQLQTYFYR